MDVFVEKIDEILNSLATFQRKKMKKKTDDEKNNITLHAAMVSYLCGEKFNPKIKEFIQVKNCCHFWGKYRGATHLEWSVQYEEHSYLPATAFNISGYDAHLKLPRTAEKFKTVTFYFLMKVLKNQSFFRLERGLEKSIGEIFYKSYSLKFIDSVRIMNDSFDSLIKISRAIFTIRSLDTV